MFGLVKGKIRRRGDKIPGNGGQGRAGLVPHLADLLDPFARRGQVCRLARAASLSTASQSIQASPRASGTATSLLSPTQLT